MNFMSDALFNSKRFSALKIIDDYNRDSLWIEMELSIGAKYVIDLLEQIVKERGKPKAIRMDKGPEFTRFVFTNWCHRYRFKSNTFNQENLFKILLLKDLIEVTESRFWIQGFLTIFWK